METEEFVELWHASFGPEAQPPECCLNLGQLTAQDVGIELRARKTRVDALQTQLKRELRQLDWLRRLVADLERRNRGEGRSSKTCRAPGGKESVRSSPYRQTGGPSSPPCLESPSKSVNTVRSRSCPPPEIEVSRRDGGKSEKGSSEYFSGQPEDSKPLVLEEGQRETRVNVKSSSDQGKGTRVSLIRERFEQGVDSKDKAVAEAVKNRLIEQGKWWSTNLFTLKCSAKSPSPVKRKRSASDSASVSYSLSQKDHPPIIKVDEEVVDNTETVDTKSQRLNTTIVEKKGPCEKESHDTNSSTVLGTHHRAVNKAEEKIVKEEKAKPKGGNTSLHPTEPRVELQGRRGRSVSPAFYSTHSLGRRLTRPRSTVEESSASATLKPRKLEEKLADRRRTGGWKVIEVSSQRRLNRSQEQGVNQPEHITERGKKPVQNSQTIVEAKTNRTIYSENSSFEGEVRSDRSQSKDEMFKAAREKLSRVTSSPPLRRRPSRDKDIRRGREGGSLHRSSNGQVEPVSSATVEEVMVEKRVERSESLLSEIMAHRFSNGLEGSQLLDSSEHSLGSGRESASGGETAGVGVGAAENTSKVIMRRRSEREADSLPEAKRRSSYLEDDDCSTPKEDYSLSLNDDNMQQGLTKSMAESSAARKLQLERLGSDTTLRQEAFEATLTPNSVPSGGAPTSLPGNVNYRQSYMSAVRDSPQMNYTPSLRETPEVECMPLIDEAEGVDGDLSSAGRLAIVSSEPNLLELDPRTLTLEDSMELDEATISAVTLSNDMFLSSRSGSVTSLPETLDESHSTSASSISESFLSPTHNTVVNLRQSSTSGGRGRRKNLKRMGNAELDQTGASLEEMLSSEGVISPTHTMSPQSTSSSVSIVSEEVRMTMNQSPPSLFSPTHHSSHHLKEVESQSPGSTRSSRIYPVRRSTVVVQGEKLVIRKLVVAGIVSAEKSYLDCLNVMKEFYRKPLLALTTTSQPILSEREINTIFYRTEDLADLHTTLHEKLEPQLRDWSVNTCVGDFFVELCKNLKLYKDYVEFYRQSLQCLEKSKSESIHFKTFLEDVRATVMTHYKDVPRVNVYRSSLSIQLLRRPIERLQSYSLILNDLCQHTPEEHRDYSVLRQSLIAMSAFIASTHDPQSFSKLSGGYNRELVKEGLMVELSEGIRKVRRVFLFHDVIVSSKQKPTRAGMKFEPKWFLPLSELSFHPPEESPEANRPVPATSDKDLNIMRNRIAELKAQIGKENTRERSGSQPEREGSFRKGRGGNRAIFTMKSSRVERTRKKLQEQQVSYWMAVPSLPLRLYGDSGKQQYIFLVHSEQERENWISSIKKLQPKAVRSVSFHPLELQDLLNHQTISELRKIEEVTQPVLEDEYLNGMLRVRIMSATDIKAKTGGIYCALELDEYGRLERKAKTLPVPTDPTTLAVTWDQDFELEVTGAHIVKVNICSKQLLKEEIFAHGKIRLPIHELRSNKRHKTDIKLYPQGSLQIIIEYSSSGSRDRKPALLSSGVFGVPIEVVAKRERHDIPLIVETCVEEVERRGMAEVGIYRVAGVLRDVRELRDAFDTDYLKAQVIAFEADIHAVAGLLKKYFRELPDALFTSDLYLSFVQGMSLSDPEARDQCLVTLLYSLPPVNFKTAIFLFKHLRRVAANSELNKMNLNNLATLFGPNLLRPAPTGQENSLLNMAAVDVATPVNVLMFFLSCPEEILDEAQPHTSPASTASTGRGKRKDSRRKLTWVEEEDGVRSVRSSRRSSGRNSQT